jgi:protein-serine/threonine kinase
MHKTPPPASPVPSAVSSTANSQHSHDPRDGDPAVTRALAGMNLSAANGDAHHVLPPAASSPATKPQKTGNMASRISRMFSGTGKQTPTLSNMKDHDVHRDLSDSSLDSVQHQFNSKDKPTSVASSRAGALLVLIFQWLPPSPAGCSTQSNL